MDRKKAFELILNDKIKAFSSKNTKATKNKLKLFHEEIHGGDVFLVFLKNAQGYYAGAEAYAGPIHEIIKQWPPLTSHNYSTHQAYHSIPYQKQTRHLAT